MKNGVPMSFIDKAWRKQTKIELRIVYLLFWKIGIRFLVALIAVSLFAYAVLVGYYFTFVEKEDILSTARIPAVLNPIHVVFVCIIIVVFLVVDKRNNVD